MNRIRTICSIHQISDKPAFEITRYGSFSLDDYLKVGAKDIHELASFIAKDISFGLYQYQPEPDGCSAFFATTPDGDLIMARDYDSASTRPFIVTTDGADGSRILGLSNAGWLMQGDNTEPTLIDQLAFSMCPYIMVDGMNEFGLSYALFSANGSRAPLDEDKITLFGHTTCATLLNKAKTVEEAVELLSQYNISWTGVWPCHYMLCDVDGNCAVVEYVCGEMQVTYMEGNYMVCSNFILYDNPTLAGFGKDRYLNYQNALEETDGVITIEKAFELLKENTIKGDEQWSVIYNLTKRTLSVTFYGDYDNIYTYSFDE